MSDFLKNFLITVLLICPFFALAATQQGIISDRLNNQELLRQEEREQWQRKQLESSPTVSLAEQAVVHLEYPAQETPCYLIKQVMLMGEERDRFSFALKALLKGQSKAVGRCLGPLGIAVAMHHVDRALRDAGYVSSHVELEQQYLSQGILMFRTHPGRLGEIRFVPNPPGVLQHQGNLWMAFPMSQGDVLKIEDMEQGIENFTRASTVEARVVIDPASEPEVSNLLVEYQQSRPFRVLATVDDSGSYATGKYQGSVTLSADNLLSLNDLFYVTLNHDLGGTHEPGPRGTRGYSAHYAIPLGYWLFSATTSKFHYYQTMGTGEQAYIYQGDSQDSSVDVSRVLYRDGTRKITGTVGGFVRSSGNEYAGVLIAMQNRRTAGWSAGINHHEVVADRVVVDTGINYRRGTGAMGAFAFQDEEDSGALHFKILTADAAIQIPFSVSMPLGGWEQPMSWSTAWHAQWDRSPLLPQDRFGIGSRYTVRGFDGDNILSAERGWWVRNELGIALGGTGQAAYMGLDYGKIGGSLVRLQALEGNALAGAVVGIRGGYKGLQYDLFAGCPVKKPDHFIAPHFATGFSVGFQV